MPQTAEHLMRTKQTWIKDQAVATATTTMEHVDLTEIDATSRGVKKPELLAKQSFYVSAASPGFITLVACPYAQQYTSQEFIWQASPSSIRPFHIVFKVTEEQVRCVGDAIEVIFFWPLSQKFSDPEPTSSLGIGFTVEDKKPTPLIRGYMSVPPFFQDDTEAALISQVQWLQKEVGVSDRFFSNLLKIKEEAFSRWRTKDGVLSKDTQRHLKEFWQTILHILSFVNFDLKLLSVMLEHIDDMKVSSAKLPFVPPWVGTSMKAYLETQGPVGIHKVDQWIQSLRFGDS